MTNYAVQVKENLMDIINQMGKHQCLFVKNPEKDFTHNRKLDFKTMLGLHLNMNRNSIYKELLDYCGYTPDMATSSAFVQQRDKILPFAFQFLLHEFNQSFKQYKTYRGYSLQESKQTKSNHIQNFINFYLLILHLIILIYTKISSILCGFVLYVLKSPMIHMKLLLPILMLRHFYQKN